MAQAAGWQLESRSQGGCVSEKQKGIAENWKGSLKNQGLWKLNDLEHRKHSVRGAWVAQVVQCTPSTQVVTPGSRDRAVMSSWISHAHSAVPQACNFLFYHAFPKLLTLDGMRLPSSQLLASTFILPPSLPTSYLSCPASFLMRLGQMPFFCFPTVPQPDSTKAYITVSHISQ